MPDHDVEGLQQHSCLASPTHSGPSAEAEQEARLSALEDGALDMLLSSAWEACMGGLVVAKAS